MIQYRAVERAFSQLAQPMGCPPATNVPRVNNVTPVSIGHDATNVNESIVEHSDLQAVVNPLCYLIRLAKHGHDLSGFSNCQTVYVHFTLQLFVINHPPGGVGRCPPGGLFLFYLVHKLDVLVYTPCVDRANRPAPIRQFDGRRE